MKRALSIALLGLVLAGCINVGEKNNAPGVVHYVLNDPAATTDAAPTRGDSTAANPSASPRTLLVLDTVAGSFYDNDQLVFSRSPGTRGQYQFARWTERPGKRFAELMRARFDREGWRVAANSGYVRGDLLLDTALVEFYHDAVRDPGQVRLVVRAELVDLSRRTLIDRRVFEQTVPVARYDAAGAAAAANVAVGQTLDALTAWLASFR